MKGGRKFTGLIIAFGLLLIGLVIVHFLKMKLDFYEVYAKWIIIGLGIFTGGNAGIAIPAVLKKLPQEEGAAGPP